MSHKGVRVRRGNLLTITALTLFALADRGAAQTDLYITNIGSDDVTIIDTATDQIKATIAVGDDPDGIAVLPSGAAVYVANFLGDEVSVIDPSTSSVTATIPVGSGPVGVAAAPNNEQVYVANRESNTVSVIDTRSLRVVATIAVGEGPNGIAVRSDGGVVYVTNSFTHSPGVVSVIDTAAGRVVDSIAVNHSPGRVAFTPDGELAYVTNYRSHNVSVIDAVSHDVVATIPVAGRATNVAVSSDGELVYVTTLGGRINVIETRMNSLFANVLVGVQPYAIGVLPSGERAYTADLRSDTTSIVDTVNHVADGQIAVGMQPFALAIRCVAIDCAAPPLTPRSTRTATPTASTTATARPSSTPRPTATPGSPPPTPGPVVVSIGENAPDPSGRASIQIAMTGAGVGGFQNDILFDNTIVALEGSDCAIAPSIGLFPRGNGGETSCLDDTTIGPCKNLARGIRQCELGDPEDDCPDEAGENVSLLRVIVAATAAPNNNVIPPGVVYTCNFRVVDAGRLPTVLTASNVVVSDPFGQRLDAAGADGLVIAGNSSAQSSSRSDGAGGGCAIDPEGRPATPLWELTILLAMLLGFHRAAPSPSDTGRKP